MTVYFGGDDDDFRPSGYTPTYPDSPPPVPPAVEPVAVTPADWDHQGDSAYWAQHRNSLVPVVQVQDSSSSAVDFFSSLVGGLFGKRPVQPAYAPPPSKMPSWLLPVAIGGIALVVVAVVATRKPSLAGYRNKRRRSRR